MQACKIAAFFLLSVCSLASTAIAYNEFNEVVKYGEGGAVSFAGAYSSSAYAMVQKPSTIPMVTCSGKRFNRTQLGKTLSNSISSPSTLTYSCNNFGFVFTGTGDKKSKTQTTFNCYFYTANRTMNFTAVEFTAKSSYNWTYGSLNCQSSRACSSGNCFYCGRDYVTYVYSQRNDCLQGGVVHNGSERSRLFGSFEITTFLILSLITALHGKGF